MQHNSKQLPTQLNKSSSSQQNIRWRRNWRFRGSGLQ